MLLIALNARFVHRVAPGILVVVPIQKQKSNYTISRMTRTIWLGCATMNIGADFVCFLDRQLIRRRADKAALCVQLTRSLPDCHWCQSSRVMFTYLTEIDRNQVDFAESNCGKCALTLRRHVCGNRVAYVSANGELKRATERYGWICVVFVFLVCRSSNGAAVQGRLRSVLFDVFRRTKPLPTAADSIHNAQFST